MAATLTQREANGRTAALRRAQAKWGNKAAVEYRKKALVKEAKDATRTAIAAIKADIDLWVEKVKCLPLRDDLVRGLADAAQFVIDVDADPTAMQSLKLALEKLKAKDHAIEQRDHFRKQLTAEQSKLHGFRCTVGTIDNMGFSVFMVLGQGDTWDEAFAAAEKK